MLPWVPCKHVRVQSMFNACMHGEALHAVCPDHHSGTRRAMTSTSVSALCPRRRSTSSSHCKGPSRRRMRISSPSSGQRWGVHMCVCVWWCLWGGAGGQFLTNVFICVCVCIHTCVCACASPCRHFVMGAGLSLSVPAHMQLRACLHAHVCRPDDVRASSLVWWGTCATPGQG